MMQLGRRWLLVLTVLAVGAAAAFGPVARRIRAVQLLSSLSAADAASRSHAGSAQLHEREVSIPSAHGAVRARLYQRAPGARDPGLVIAHGVHYQGIDERRLVPFARELARSGRSVLTPELSDLRNYRITERGVDVIADAVFWLSEQSDLVAERRVGLLGFSFAGGLSLVAAERARVRERLEFVSSVGGHHDLGRVLRFFLTNRIDSPNGALAVRAHEYGLVVLVYQHIERFVDEPDLPLLRSSLNAWLREDRHGALAFASRRTTASGERLFTLLEGQRLLELRPELERAIAENASGLRRVSPAGRLKRLGVPVYLLHGAADSVIPPSEADWAARELGEAAHRALVSPLLEHVEVNRTAGLYDELALVEFMARLL